MAKPTCSVDGCDGPTVGRGYCRKHYKRWSKHGDPLVTLIDREGAKGCSVDGCDAPHSGRGYCAVHYQHWHRYGDPLTRYVKQETCDFPGCDKPHESRGYCGGHANQLRQGRELQPLQPLYRGAECSVFACDKPAVARMWCHKHWKRWKANGDPLILQVPREVARRPGRERRPKAEPAWGGRHRKYALNEHYFDEIADEHRAYWLGFITADGGVVRRNYALKIELAECDVDQVRKFNADIGYEGPIRWARGCVVTAVHSWRMIEALERVGITERKSAIVEPWDGPADLMPHYWRGLFDGDGSIYKIGTRTDWCLNICGSKACVDGFADWAKAVCGSRGAVRLVRGSCWAWDVTGTRKPQRLAEALYGCASVALVRKRVLAEELRAIDWDERRRLANAARSESLRNAWMEGMFASRKPRRSPLTEGTHPRCSEAHG